MSLNPLRDPLIRAGRDASKAPSPISVEADAALAGFTAVRKELERLVKNGELTVSTARSKAAEAANRLRGLLVPKANGFSPVPKAFLDRLVEASENRRKARENAAAESLQRETNDLLRKTLVEQQLVGRAAEFEAQAYVRPVGGGVPAPTLNSLLQFHAGASRAGDLAAMEWGRRQLEAIRIRIVEDEDVRKIDAATDRPDRLNPRIVSRYTEALAASSHEQMEEFVTEALEARDANACAAAFGLAREAPEGPSARWVRKVLEGLDRFPDVALEGLRAWEVEARARDEEAARARVEFTAVQAETDARLAGLEAPSPAEVERIQRDLARPVAAPDEPIGLALNRRGILPTDAHQPQPEV
jgi:hypothetical protein